MEFSSTLDPLRNSRTNCVIISNQILVISKSELSEKYISTVYVNVVATHIGFWVKVFFCETFEIPSLDPYITLYIIRRNYYLKR